MKKDERKDRPDPPKQAEDTTKPEKGEPKPGMKYVFKISPADPKNTLDFEDVADK